MRAILKFDFQKRQQLRFSEVNYLNYNKKDPILHVATTLSLKLGETRTSHEPIPHPLRLLFIKSYCVLATDSIEGYISQIEVSRENTLLSLGCSKLKAAHLVNHFPGFFG